MKILATLFIPVVQTSVIHYPSLSALALPRDPVVLSARGLLTLHAVKRKRSNGTCGSDVNGKGVFCSGVNGKGKGSSGAGSGTSMLAVRKLVVHSRNHLIPMDQVLMKC